MSEDAQLRQAQAAAKAGDYRRAREILLPLQSERAKKWLAQVNEKILAEQETKAPPPEKPKASKPLPEVAPKQKVKEKPKTDPKQAGIGCLVLLFICAFICLLTQPKPLDESTPENKVKAAVAASFGSDRLDGTRVNRVDDTVVSVTFPLSELSEEFAIRDAELNMPELICELRDRGFTRQEYLFEGTIPTVDTVGNTGIATGIQAVIEPEMINAINCESARAYMVDIRAISYSFVVFDILR